MMTKNTRIVPDSSQYQLWRDTKHVATIYDHDDACLFNAAPDLLAALEMVARRYDDLTLCWCARANSLGMPHDLSCKKAGLAIAKAKGEP